MNKSLDKQINIIDDLLLCIPDKQEVVKLLNLLNDEKYPVGRVSHFSLRGFFKCAVQEKNFDAIKYILLRIKSVEYLCMFVNEITLKFKSKFLKVIKSYFDGTLNKEDRQAINSYYIMMEEIYRERKDLKLYFMGNMLNSIHYLKMFSVVMCEEDKQMIITKISNSTVKEARFKNIKQFHNSFYVALTESQYDYIDSVLLMEKMTRRC